MEQHTHSSEAVEDDQEEISQHTLWLSFYATV